MLPREKNWLLLNRNNRLQLENIKCAWFPDPDQTKTRPNGAAKRGQMSPNVMNKPKS